MWHFHQKALASFSRENFRVQDWTTIQNKKMDSTVPVQLFQNILENKI